MLTIGVTGHRFLRHTDRVIAGVDRAIDRIEDAFGAHPSAVISALAEGADRLVVDRVLARSEAKLIIALPLPQSDYTRDFDSSESIQMFLDFLARAHSVITLPLAATRNEAYAAAGVYVLDHCDALIAVWDGQPAQGTGGTAEIVAEARRRGLPLAWVRAGNNRPGTRHPVTLNEEHGEVIFERFPVIGSQRGHPHGP
ncbi:MAG: hypothetical protein R6X31_09830 [Anaerolineae bacterium]